MLIVPINYDQDSLIAIFLVISVSVYFLFRNRKFYYFHFFNAKKILKKLLPLSWQRDCLWTFTEKRSKSLTEWVCLKCGQKGYSKNSNPPSQCQKFLRQNL